MELADAHVVVTGAGRGIGAALARRFHAGGARVVVADVLDPDGVASGLPGAVAVVADISTERGNVELIDTAEAAFGPIDLFFANAGVAIGTDLTTSEEEWQLAFDVNVNAHRWAAARLLDGWLDRGRGYFCSTASAAGLLSQIGSAPYTLTKRAAVAFAEWLSITYGDQGIRVTCLCPQGVNTAMLQSLAEPPQATRRQPRSDQTLRRQTTAWPGNAVSAVKASGAVLEPQDVAEVTASAIADERFLVLPHPEVHDYALRKATDIERWLAGMRRLNRRVAGPPP
jgi:NAD(P)-dependent dehydrogenase (short-subunit alcohol dehydrogenase family)